MARPRLRAFTALRYKLYSLGCAIGSTPLQRVSAAQGAQQVRAGVWEECVDEDGCLCFRILPPLKKDDNNLAAGSSPAAITASEMMLFAGQHFKGGRSRTAHLTEEKRVLRKHPKTDLKLTEEDAVERIAAKVRVWPELGGTTKDILRVWPNGKQ